MAAICPPPPIAADCDLRDFPYMELDVRRLRDSQFAASASAEGFRAGVLLWCAAWHQLPAGSLPDNDIELSVLAGYGRVVKEWRKVRADALRGFVRCSDGRLYHSVIVSKALAAHAAKLRHAYGKFVDRTRKENKSREAAGAEPVPVPPFEEWKATRESARSPGESHAISTGIPSSTALKANQERTEQEQKGTTNAPAQIRTAVSRCHQGFDLKDYGAGVNDDGFLA